MTLFRRKMMACEVKFQNFSSVTYLCILVGKFLFDFFLVPYCLWLPKEINIALCFNVNLSSDFDYFSSM